MSFVSLGRKVLERLGFVGGLWAVRVAHPCGYGPEARGATDCHWRWSLRACDKAVL